MFFLFCFQDDDIAAPISPYLQSESDSPCLLNKGLYDTFLLPIRKSLYYMQPENSFVYNSYNHNNKTTPCQQLYECYQTYPHSSHVIVRMYQLVIIFLITKKSLSPMWIYHLCTTYHIYDQSFWYVLSRGQIGSTIVCVCALGVHLKPINKDLMLLVTIIIIINCATGSKRELCSDK